MAMVLSDKDRALLDAYWRAANYLSVASTEADTFERPAGLGSPRHGSDADHDAAPSLELSSASSA